MKALSLFNGISGLHLALDNAGIAVDTIYYAEIDKFANMVTETNYPMDVQLGDVTLFETWDIDWSSIDLVSAGFPCQSWSIAGKQLGDKDPRGALFWVTLAIIGKVMKHNPKARFIMENVKMKTDFEAYITHHTKEALGVVEKILINSDRLVPQSRNRYYWTNFECAQPATVDISLVDILEGNYLPDVKNLSVMKNGNAYALTARYAGAVAWNSCEKKQRTMIPYRYAEVDETTDVFKGLKYRKLTPVECERLQGIPDNFTAIISNSQRYKAIGNGWTIPVIRHLLKEAFK